MNRIAMFALSVGLLAQTTAFAKPPGLSEQSLPQGKERSPMQREFYESDDAPGSLGSGLPLTNPRRSSHPEKSESVETASVWLNLLTLPLGLAQQGMWIKK